VDEFPKKARLQLRAFFVDVPSIRPVFSVLRHPLSEFEERYPVFKRDFSDHRVVLPKTPLVVSSGSVVSKVWRMRPRRQQNFRTVNSGDGDHTGQVTSEEFGAMLFEQPHWITSWIR